MDIKELIQAGKLTEVRQQLVAAVNDTPIVGLCDTDATLFPFLESCDVVFNFPGKKGCDEEKD